ncbi:DUF2809 domain-containing protein [Flavobacterium sp.]|uniref:ribosomal maturation YjgA family protein n=1 Tax=Flavobacterium sp. TaxID=239 RepID=UPI00286D5F47|nr:DUF2809 domain-containing protein [Flavobacterium sp.]
MLRNTRIFYFLITLLVVLLGILSRKINAIPLFIGDILYAVMVYFGCRLLFINGSNLKKIIFPLLFCYLIELQQLYNAEWLVAIRNTPLGHYALGQGFLWSDLVCYTLGIVMTVLIDCKILRR